MSLIFHLREAAWSLQNVHGLKRMAIFALLAVEGKDIAYMRGFGLDFLLTRA